MSALYSDAVEPILIQVVPKYNPSSYLEDTFATSMQVRYLFIYFLLNNALRDVNFIAKKKIIRFPWHRRIWRFDDVLCPTMDVPNL